MSPSLDDIQQALNKSTSFVLEVSRGIAQWGQQRFRRVDEEESGGKKTSAHHVHKAPADDAGTHLSYTFNLEEFLYKKVSTF